MLNALYTRSPLMFAGVYGVSLTSCVRKQRVSNLPKGTTVLGKARERESRDPEVGGDRDPEKERGTETWRGDKDPERKEQT